MKVQKMTMHELLVSNRILMRIETFKHIYEHLTLFANVTCNKKKPASFLWTIRQQSEESGSRPRYRWLDNLGRDVRVWDWSARGKIRSEIG